MILGGDLGGTKTLLALAERGNGQLRIIQQQRFASADYASFDDLLDTFLGDAPPIQAAGFGLAGPTDGQTGQLTYLPWRLSADAICRRYGIAKVHLANDFAAAAHGIPLLEADQIRCLHPGIAEKNAPCIILGAGTGLGVAGLLPDGNRYRVIPGEGGHIGFSPQTQQQVDLASWLLIQNGRVTTEDIVSGPGLARIYAFLSGRPQQAPCLPEVVGQAALSGSAPIARQALDLWLACYGAFAGDLALHWLAHGGVYLAGGMAAKLMPHCDITPFMNAFLAKREHADLVKIMPVFLSTAEDIGLSGALAIAADAIE